MKWTGRPKSTNIEDRRQAKSAFSQYGKKRYGARLNARDATKRALVEALAKKQRKSRTNGR